MPQSEPETRAHVRWLVLKSTATLLFTGLLCLPSLLGGAALLLQRALYRDISQWPEVPSAMIALGSFVGAPLVSVAAVVGGIIVLSRLPTQVKYAYLCVVGIAALATMSLLFGLTK